MKVDLLVENARALTMDQRRSTASRIAILNGWVVAVDEECDGLTARRTVDAGGVTVTPGFNDAHAHSVWFGHTLLETSLANCADLVDLYDRIRSGSRSKGAGEWVVGSGYNHMDTGLRYPDPDELDRASGGRPVWIKHTSGHSCIVSRAAMRAIGMTGDEVIDGGVVVKDESGRPTGLLEERAMVLVQDFMLPAPQTQIVEALAAATREYVREGLTSVTDAGIGGGWIGHSAQEFGAYQDAHAAGVLLTRMQPMLVSDVLEHVALNRDGSGFRGVPSGLRTGLGDDRLQLGPLKIFLDGSIISSTARMSEEYHHCPGSHGYFQGDVDVLRSHALEAARSGWALAMHAVGDEAIELALDIVTTLRAEGIEPPLPHRIEHGGVVTPDQVTRLAAANLPIVTQPNFVSLYGDGFRGYLGDARTGWSFRMRSLLDAGLPVAGSSDRPVAPGAPLTVMQAAIERTTPEGFVYAPDDRLTAEQALHAYTVGSAEVTGWGQAKGRIMSGQLADFVFLSDSPLDVPTNEISQIEVLATVVGGEPVFDEHGLFGWVA